MINLKGRNFLKLLDFSPDEIQFLLDSATEFKKKKRNGIDHRLFTGKNIALIFEKPSTRTRCAFEVAANDLGINAVYLDSQGTHIGKKESCADTARVLGRMFDGIEYRGYAQTVVEDLAKYSGVPVWNGLTNEAHPTQVLADLLTITEHCGRLKGIKLVYMGDARFNMANSLMAGCAKMGMHFVACSPKKYFPDKVLIDECFKIAKETGAFLEFEEDPLKATKGADIIYTDVWVSMGEPETVWRERIDDLLPYRVDRRLMENAAADCKFMHCLPAFHNLNTKVGKEIFDKYGLDSLEVTNDVFESKSSLVFDEAENRMHTIKAVLAETL